MTPRRPWLLPLVPLYWLGLQLKNHFGLHDVARLRGLVVSVGSLSAGGAGKTPVVLLVADLLRGAGYAVDVLSRGYGRNGTGVERVDPGGDPARFGDEPTLIARRLGIPVWVGPYRYRSGLAAEAEALTRGIAPGALAHVLDDGFQHRVLRRAMDVVLLTQHDLDDCLIPAGNLREGLRALRRADIVVLREEEAEALRKHVPAKTMTWIVRRTLRFDQPPPSRPLVFCAIARPEGLFAMLAANGVTASAAVTFRDHHSFTMPDITHLIAAARTSAADAFLITEKDDVKLTPAMRQRLQEVAPIAVARLDLTLVNGSVWDLGVH